jgi:hypothetical protein
MTAWTIDRRRVLGSDGGQAAIARRWLTGETVSSIARSFGYRSSDRIDNALWRFVLHHAGRTRDGERDDLIHVRWKVDKRATVSEALENWARN